MTAPTDDPASSPAPGRMDISGRVRAVLPGRRPDRIPFISRMDFWYRGLSFQSKIPEAYREMELSEIHQAIGFGQEDWLCPCRLVFLGLYSQ
jgi:hypothetical protein